MFYFFVFVLFLSFHSIFSGKLSPSELLVDNEEKKLHSIFSTSIQRGMVVVVVVVVLGVFSCWYYYWFIILLVCH